MRVRLRLHVADVHGCARRGACPALVVVAPHRHPDGAAAERLGLDPERALAAARLHAAIEPRDAGAVLEAPAAERPARVARAGRPDLVADLVDPAVDAL